MCYNGVNADLALRAVTSVAMSDRLYHTVGRPRIWGQRPIGSACVCVGGGGEFDGALNGGPPCRMSNLRNVPALFIKCPCRF